MFRSEVTVRLTFKIQTLAVEMCAIYARDLCYTEHRITELAQWIMGSPVILLWLIEISV